MKLRKDDLVIVISGKDKGKIGKIRETSPKNERVLVEGVNIVSRHVKPSNSNPKGGVVKSERPVHVSNVMFLDPSSKTPSRIGFKFNAEGEKIRFSKKSGGLL